MSSGCNVVEPQLGMDGLRQPCRRPTQMHAERRTALRQLFTKRLMEIRRRPYLHLLLGQLSARYVAHTVITFIHDRTTSATCVYFSLSLSVYIYIHWAMSARPTYLPYPTSPHPILVFPHDFENQSKICPTWARTEQD